MSSLASSSRVKLEHLLIRRDAQVLLKPARPINRQLIGTCKARGYAKPALAVPRVTFQNKLSELSARWNSMSGYDHIEQLKARVSKQSEHLKGIQDQLHERRRAYVGAVSERSTSQRQLSDLLSRKPSWTEEDLSRYTNLLHSEHSQARAEKEAQKDYEDAEEQMQDAFDDLMRAITQRYHEEHIWSDRMRSLSTWGSVGIAVLNALIFTLAIFLVEPYKRKRLAQTLEGRLVAGEAENTARLERAITSFEDKINAVQVSMNDMALRAESVEEKPEDRTEAHFGKDVLLGTAVGVAVALTGYFAR